RLVRLLLEDDEWRERLDRGKAGHTGAAGGGGRKPRGRAADGAGRARESPRGGGDQGVKNPHHGRAAGPGGAPAGVRGTRGAPGEAAGGGVGPPGGPDAQGHGGRRRGGAGPAGRPPAPATRLRRGRRRPALENAGGRPGARREAAEIACWGVNRS